MNYTKLQSKLDKINKQTLKTMYLDLLVQYNTMRDYAWDIYQEARISAELLNEYIGKDIYPKLPPSKYNSDCITHIAERYNTMMDTRLQNYIDDGTMAYIRIAYEHEYETRRKTEPINVPNLHDMYES